MQSEDGLCYIKQLAGHWYFAKQVYLYLHTYSIILTVVQLHSDLATQRKHSFHLPFDLLLGIIFILSYSSRKRYYDRGEQYNLRS